MTNCLFIPGVFRAFSEECWGGMAWNWACWCILTTSELIMFWSGSVDFAAILTDWNGGNLGFWGILWRRHWEEWPEIWLDYVSCSPSGLIRFWSWFVEYSIFNAIFSSNLWFTVIFWRTWERNSLKFGILMYPDHHQNWLDFGHQMMCLQLLSLQWITTTMKSRAWNPDYIFESKGAKKSMTRWAETYIRCFASSSLQSFMACAAIESKTKTKFKDGIAINHKCTINISNIICSLHYLH